MDTLSAHRISVNLKTVFNTHVKHIPTDTIYMEQ